MPFGKGVHLSNVSKAVDSLLGGCQVNGTYNRAESFNFSNHTNLANPNNCVDCPGTAGRIFGAFSNYVPRQWQMALKYSF